MKVPQSLVVDGNEAVAMIAHRVSEVIAIYPITPSSTMGELADEWSSKGQTNIWGKIPEVMEMQSEAGAAGAVHGALQAGALSTTFTASQGLLLMIPNMYKIAGELTSFTMHVAARALATHALSIFGDHSDVMACRQTGFAMLASGSVQEAHDIAAIAHAATLPSRVPFLHFFDGFRTSHEVAKIKPLTDEELSIMVPIESVGPHRERALTPDHPVVRGTAQNPDTFFQAREAINRYYDACADMVQVEMDRFATLTGRQYHLFDYHGHPQAERVIIIMGSGAEVTHEAVDRLVAKGEKVGVLKIRLFRPFKASAFLKALPKTVRAIAVLDRTKEPGSLGEPLYQDVLTALLEARQEKSIDAPTDRDVEIIGGRYGLGSKEFTPGMAKAVFDELSRETKRRHFTVGINDDVTNLSLVTDTEFDVEPDDVFRAVFYGIGSDGTVGATKNSVKMIGEGTDKFAQGYFSYDSKKSGTVTVSYVRASDHLIRSSYLISSADFTAVHDFGLIMMQDVGAVCREGGTLLLNVPYPVKDVWDTLPAELQQQIINKRLKVYCINAGEVAEATGMGRRINTIMQAAFFATTNVLPLGNALAEMKNAIKKSYAKKGDEIVKKNCDAVDQALEHLVVMTVPGNITGLPRPLPVSDNAPDFVKEVTACMLSGKGDILPVSAFAPDGTWPTGTTKFEKRNLADEIPVWEPDLCIQCNKCAIICPHAAIRPKVVPADALSDAPDALKHVTYKAPDFKGQQYLLQVAPEDCTGCTLCEVVCPAVDKKNPERKALNMAAQRPIREQEVANFDYFLKLPDPDRGALRIDVKGSQFMEPLFEFSGACVGCGETPYVKLLTQLFGDRSLIANATGCSSIFGGNLPTTPYTKNKFGRGPAWSNSLFEDNAEFGLGMRLAVDSHREQAKLLLADMREQVGGDLADALLNAEQKTEVEIEEQRARVREMEFKLKDVDSSKARRLKDMGNYLVKKTVWIVGGDGWAYDIGFGGLDHVLATGRNVNILVLDTEVYSNTGGQSSKSTPIGASAKFAAAGKTTGKKDLGLMAMSYGSVYVAQVALGAKDTQTVKAFLEAESYPGPSLIIAYSPCIAHGFEMDQGPDQQKLAVQTGYWPLFRYDPRRLDEGKNPFQLDSSEPDAPLEDFMNKENRFKVVAKSGPDRYAGLLSQAKQKVASRFAFYEQLAAVQTQQASAAPGASKDAAAKPGKAD